MQQPATAEQWEGRDVTIEDACPICDGPLAARLTRSRVVAWCGTCRRISRPVLLPGPDGASLLHPSALA